MGFLSPHIKKVTYPKERQAINFDSTKVDMSPAITKEIEMIELYNALAHIIYLKLSQYLKNHEVAATIAPITMPVMF